MTTSFAIDAARALGGPAWLADRRAAAAERFAAAALPTPAEEIWRYSRIDELDLDRFRPAPPVGDADTAAFVATALTTARAVTEWAGVVVCVNGRVAHVELDDALASKGVVAGDLASLDGEWVREHLGRCSSASPDAFVDLHDAFLAGGAAIHVPAGVVVERPLLVVHRSDGDGLASFPHTLVVAGDDAELTVADHFSSPDVEHFTSAVVELVVGDAARLRYVNLQVHGPRLWQVALQRAHLGRDATVRSSALALGGDYARLRSEALLAGQGAHSDQLAVYYADGNQMLDFRTLQDHDAPRTTSELLFKGAVEDDARSVYSGLVRLRTSAQKARALQTNRNLVLSERAAAESIPNLEIEANDVQCSHASAVGPIDDDQLFYLESRGIPPAIAERLIVFGFFEDVIARLPVPGLAAPLRQAVIDKWGANRG